MVVEGLIYYITYLLYKQNDPRGGNQTFLVKLESNTVYRISYYTYEISE